MTNIFGKLTKLPTDYDKRSLNNLCLSIESYNGDDWNHLMRLLSDLYKSLDQDDSLQYFMQEAAFLSHDLVAKYYEKIFPSGELLHLNRSKMIAGASASIAYGAMQEFQIGNFWS